jgi:hypothetical protein
MDNTIIIVLVMLFSFMLISTTISSIGGYYYYNQQGSTSPATSPATSPTTSPATSPTISPTISPTKSPAPGETIIQAQPEKVEFCKNDLMTGVCTSNWDCYLNNSIVNNVNISMEHIMSGATNMCNSLPECNGKCVAKYNRIKSAPNLIQITEMEKDPNISKEQLKEAKLQAKEAYSFNIQI